MKRVCWMMHMIIIIIYELEKLILPVTVSSSSSSSSSSLPRRFVIVRVSLHPLTLLLQSPVCLHNQTHQTVFCQVISQASSSSSSTPTPNHVLQLTLQPNQPQFLPFSFTTALYSFTLRCDLPSFMASSPIAFDAGDVGMVTVQCPHSNDLQHQGEDHKWHCCVEVCPS